MRDWIRQLDRILRGEATRLSSLKSGSIDVSAGGLVVIILLLGMFYGVCMGSFAIVSGRAGTYLQMLSSMAKVPALFLLTLAVTFPSLYVFNALVGSRLTLISLLRLIVAALSVMLALLASFGTIVAFFSFTTTSYPFMVILNVLVFAVSGFLGLSFLLQTLHRLTLAQVGPEEPPRPITPPPPPPLPEPITETGQPPIASEKVAEFVAQRAVPAEVLEIPGALDRLDERAISRNVKLVFRFWVIVFGLVGAQMSWVLRPFIGGGPEFVLFRPRGSNFFEAVFHHLAHLLGW